MTKLTTKRISKLSKSEGNDMSLELPATGVITRLVYYKLKNM